MDFDRQNPKVNARIFSGLLDVSKISSSTCKKHDMMRRPNLSPNSTEATRTTDVVCGLFCVMFDCDMLWLQCQVLLIWGKLPFDVGLFGSKMLLHGSFHVSNALENQTFSHKELHRRPFCMAENDNNTCCFLESGAWALHPPKCILVMKYHQRLEMMGGGAKRNQRQRVWKGRIVQRCQNRVQSQKSKAEKDWGALPWA